MARTVTAVYRTREVANLLRRALADLGINAADIRVVPKLAQTVDAAHEDSRRKALDDVRNLPVPDEDRDVYADAVRRGDVVVSVTADDALVARVREIMRQPEDVRDFAATDLAPHHRNRSSA